MNIKGWECYNHAAIPICAPHEIPDTSVIDDGSIAVADKGNYFKMVGHKSIPEYESRHVNAAVLYKVFAIHAETCSLGS